MDEKKPELKNFIRDIIDHDLESGKHELIHTRFPPEPNGYLHIGHAKSICLNAGIAKDYKGICNLRFDDTNPSTEDTEYVESIKEDAKWLGLDYGENLFFASDYFDKMYELAVRLIKNGKAYVCSLSKEETREYRGTISEPGKNSPYRDRSVEENLKLFEQMRDGEFEEGTHVLRAKIDMSAANMLMRDPMLYRIMKAPHHRTGDKWSIYPMYDYAHCLEDSFENITHSLCTLEFANNRELYDWVIDNTNVPCKPQQTEFARLNLDYTVLSKRKLIQLVEEGHVKGWDDPRMPTVAGLRRRGVPAAAIWNFCEMIGVAKVNSSVDMGKLEFCIRDFLNPEVPRLMCVAKPLKLTITNYPEAASETLEAALYPHDVPKEGSREIKFSRNLYIERDDFSDNPPAKWFRLKPGAEVRLRYAYIIKCEKVIRDENGEVIELLCSYDPDTKSGSGSKKKVKGVIHWVDADTSVNAEIRTYDRLFSVAKPDGDPEKDFLEYLNPDSLVVNKDALVESFAAKDNSEFGFQFERQGYFKRDPIDSGLKPVFNLIVNLKDSWEKESKPAEEKQISEPKTNQQKKKDSSSKPTQRPGKLSKANERENLRKNNKTLSERFENYKSNLGIKEVSADILTGSLKVSDFYEECLLSGVNAQALAKWVVQELLSRNENLSDLNDRFSAKEFSVLVKMAQEASLSTAIARQVLDELLENGGSVETIINSKGLSVIEDQSEIEALIESVLNENKELVERYRSGKTQVIGAIIGQIMKASKGKADAKKLKPLLEKMLG